MFHDPHAAFSFCCAALIHITISIKEELSQLGTSFYNELFPAGTQELLLLQQIKAKVLRFGPPDLMQMTRLNVARYSFAARVHKPGCKPSKENYIREFIRVYRRPVLRP